MAERWLIVGLGNPGPQYEGTRHNVGFHVLHALAQTAGIAGKRENRFQAMVGTGRWRDASVILAQPLTYMNLSGEAVGKLVQYYDMAPDRLLVIYDEAALPFGRLRVRPGGSDAGQKGMRSIIQHIGTSDFPRIRIGIGAPPIPQMRMPDHVLSRFTAEEQALLPEITQAAIAAVEMVMQDGIEAAMARFNGMDFAPSASP